MEKAQARVGTLSGAAAAARPGLRARCQPDSSSSTSPRCASTPALRQGLGDRESPQGATPHGGCSPPTHGRSGAAFRSPRHHGPRQDHRARNPARADPLPGSSITWSSSRSRKNGRERPTAARSRAFHLRAVHGRSRAPRAHRLEPHVPPSGLLEKLRAGGWDLASLTTRHASLEDVFVSLTGRQLRDE